MKLLRFLRLLFYKKSRERYLSHIKTYLKDQPLKTENHHPFLTMSEAAKKHGVTRQAIFFAIKMNRLNANRKSGTWLISDEDLTQYIESKYSRDNSKKDGRLIFDKVKGYYSIGETAKILNRSPNHIYYLVRMGKIKSRREGGAIVIRDVDLDAYVESINNKNIPLQKIS